MKEIRITWAEIVLFLIGAAVTIYRIVTDIISYTGMQIMLLEYDPGTAAYEERAASLPFPLIDCGICAFILLALIIRAAVRTRKQYPTIRLSKQQTHRLRPERASGFPIPTVPLLQ